MLRIITLLTQKNHYLEKFFSSNEDELANFSAGNFDHLDSFYQKREKILEMIKYLDDEIDKTVGDDHLLTAQDKKTIRDLFGTKEQYVKMIVAQDLEILQCIEKAKSTIIRELQNLKHTKKAVGSYRSKTFNRQLDEEA
jgi:uncharacterized iron-regulated protein